MDKFLHTTNPDQLSKSHLLSLNATLQEQLKESKEFYLTLMQERDGYKAQAKHARQCIIRIKKQFNKIKKRNFELELLCADRLTSRLIRQEVNTELQELKNQHKEMCDAIFDVDLTETASAAAKTEGGGTLHSNRSNSRGESRRSRQRSRQRLM